ncbi:MAG: (d)CMP kinase [Formosimonas sp.]
MGVIITLDGPTASGKGAVAAALAEHLGFAYLDSGALYRLVAWQALHAGWTLDTPLDEEHKLQLADWARHLNVTFTHQRIILNDADVTELIRAEAVGNMASKIAVLALVRSALLQRQRDFAQGAGLVADGRDMGSVVFPEAQVKVFLTASSQVRAERRYKQLINKGFSASMRDLVADLNERDERDSKRIHAPLKPAQGAYVLDSSDLTLDETVAKILAYYASIVLV